MVGRAVALTAYWVIGPTTRSTSAVLCAPATSCRCNAQYRTRQRAGDTALGRGTQLRMAESVSPSSPAVRETGRYAPSISNPRVHSDLLEVLASSIPVVVRFAEYASSCRLAVKNFLFASMRSKVGRFRFVKISFVRSRKTAWSAWIAPGQV